MRADKCKGATMPTHPSQGNLEKARAEQNIAYIRQMLGELGSVARSENADMLCYLIEMAYLEAGDVLAGTRPLRMVERPG
jgi:hypothetical protein